MTSSFTLSHTRNLFRESSFIFPTSSRQEKPNSSQVEESVQSLLDGTRTPREQAALESKVVASLYAQSLEICLSQAIELEGEIAWWKEVERNRSATAMYLVQTFPIRLARVSRHVLDIFRDRGPEVLTWESIRTFFATSVPSSSILSVSYPHLQHTHPPRNILMSSPLSLARKECQYHRKELEKLRDEKAQMLGEVSELRILLETASADADVDNGEQFTMFLWKLRQVLSAKGPATDLEANQDLVVLSESALNRININVEEYSSRFDSLCRPRNLTLIWPKLVVYPTVGLYLIQWAYSSRTALWETALDAKETIKGFWVGWVLTPLRDIINTVRAGGDNDEGLRIVTKDGLRADMESLERMTISLCSEKLGYSQEQLDVLRANIRAGDLTPVLQLYEQDIKSPVKNALVGSLVRTLLIQIQKTKVDIDVAMSGIDKLLKSQELTFAFVGVAPALAITYFLAGWSKDAFFGGRSRGRYGGKAARTRVWSEMRRVERLLSSSHHETPQRTEDLRTYQASQISLKNITGKGIQQDLLPPLTNGLIILSLTHLREYASRHLPPRSRLSEGFLEDIADLEDPQLGRKEKTRVVDRMWRSWSPTLGWDRIPISG